MPLNSAVSLGPIAGYTENPSLLRLGRVGVNLSAANDLRFLHEWISTIFEFYYEERGCRRC
jgi:hypothetical protein